MSAIQIVRTAHVIGRAPTLGCFPWGVGIGREVSSHPLSIFAVIGTFTGARMCTRIWECEAQRKNDQP